MRTNMPALAAVLSLGAVLVAAPAPAQTTTASPLQPDPFIVAVGMGNTFLRHQITAAASSMTEEDYAFRPTPDVRTFGQILAHIADNNYAFCSEARGESDPPVKNVEGTRTTKAEIDEALSASFEYCGTLYASMTDEKARALVQFGKRPLPALAVLMFKSFHNSLHYGNVITYVRLRGKVPPPSRR